MNVIETIEKDLMKLVAGHDWSYMMSDDHNVWAAGLEVEKSIKAKIHALIVVHREDGAQLYKNVKSIAGTDYTDYDKYGDGLKYRTINGWFKDYTEVEHLNWYHPEIPMNY
jgi:hypothetical protein